MNLKNDSLVLLGASVGGIVGIVAFIWLFHQGFYGLMLPGGLLGIGAGLFQAPSKGVAIACGVMALAFGLIAEWYVLPFKADSSLGYFAMHFYDLKPVTLLMILVGAAIGFWIPFRRGQK
jgi:hypothetical protein